MTPGGGGLAIALIVLAASEASACKCADDDKVAETRTLLFEGRVTSIDYTLDAEPTRYRRVCFDVMLVRFGDAPKSICLNSMLGNCSLEIEIGGSYVIDAMRDPEGGETWFSKCGLSEELGATAFPPRVLGLLSLLFVAVASMSFFVWSRLRARSR